MISDLQTGSVRTMAPGRGPSVRGGGGGPDTVWIGLTAYWKLEEATGAPRLDATGNGNTLTDTGANIAKVAGIINSCGSSAGGGQCLEIPDNNFVGLTGPGNSFSCSFWVKSNGVANCNIISKWASTDNLFGRGVMDWSIGTTGSNNLCFNINCPGLFDTGVIFGVALNNTFQHLVMVYDSPSKTILRYANGSSCGTTAGLADIQRSAAPFALFNYPSVHAAGMPGLLDEVGLWSRALTAAEVAHLYNSGAGLPFV